VRENCTIRDTDVSKPDSNPSKFNVYFEFQHFESLAFFWAAKQKIGDAQKLFQNRFSGLVKNKVSSVINIGGSCRRYGSSHC